MTSIELLMLTIYKMVPLCLILGAGSWLIVTVYEWLFGPIDEEDPWE